MKPQVSTKITVYGGLVVDRKQLDACYREMALFVDVVEKMLEEIQKDLSKAANFNPIAEKMVKIKGSARQMNMNQVADLAEIAEEIAVKGARLKSRPVIRKVSGALWDAVTTLNYMLRQVKQDTSTEANILMTRLQSALASLGGARIKVSQEEVDRLLKGQYKKVKKKSPVKKVKKKSK